LDPRTFIPPRQEPLAPTPRPGDAAPGLPLALKTGRPAIVAFLRHTGCPFAELTMRMLREGAVNHPEIEWIAVSHAPPEATELWCSAVGGSNGVLVTCDPSHRAYADWGLGRTSLGHFLGRDSLGAAAGLARRGIRNRHPHGTRWQSAGTFALDASGTVRWRHLPAHAGDMPDLDAAVRATD
jgi:hypothetical protein